MERTLSQATDRQDPAPTGVGPAGGPGGRSRGLQWCAGRWTFSIGKTRGDSDRPPSPARCDGTLAPPPRQQVGKRLRPRRAAAPLLRGAEPRSRYLVKTACRRELQTLFQLLSVSEALAGDWISGSTCLGREIAASRANRTRLILTGQFCVISHRATEDRCRVCLPPSPACFSKT